MIDESRWYTPGQASKAIGGFYSVAQLRARLKLGQIKHEVIPPLKEGGRITYKIRGDELLRLYGAALIATQPRERPEPIRVRLRRCFQRTEERRSRQKAEVLAKKKQKEKDLAAERRAAAHLAKLDKANQSTSPKLNG